MAAAATNLANFGNTSSFTTSWTTGTLSIPADSVVLAFAGGVKNNGDATWDATNPFSISNSTEGATGWNNAGWWWLAGTSGYWPCGVLFWKYFASAVSRTITLSAGARSLQLGYDIVAVTGVDSASPVVQVKGTVDNWADNGNAHAQSVTLDAAPTLGDPVMWFMNSNRTSTADAAALPSGLTSLINPAVVYQPTAAAWSDAVTATTYGSSDIGTGVYTATSVVVELKKQAAAGVDQTAFFAAF